MALRPICEPVELPLGASVLVERVAHPADSPGSGRLLHFHDLGELVLFERAKGWFFADGRRHAIGDGAIAFVPSMRHHDFDLAPGAKAWRLVQIDPYLVEQLALQAPLARLARPFCALPEATQRRRIETLAEWLEAAVAEDSRAPKVTRIVELLLVAVLEAREAGAGTPTGDQAQVERLLPVVERLRLAPRETVPLEDAAAMCSLSPAYFSRRFKQVFGMNFTEYARAYRLHLAARRIVATRAPVSDIAYGLGFSSASHFTARFRDRFGMTPREYRSSARRRTDR